MKKSLVSLALLSIVGCAPSRLTGLSWLEKSLPHIETVGDATQRISDLMPHLAAGDTTKAVLINTQIARIQRARTALRGIPPPKECQEIHEVLLSGIDDYLLGVEYGLEGIRQPDAGLVRQGSKYVTSSLTKFERVALMLREMR